MEKKCGTGKAREEKGSGMRREIPFPSHPSRRMGVGKGIKGKGHRKEEGMDRG